MVKPIMGVLLTPLFMFFSLSLATAATYNVVTLGAKGDGTSDSTNSFLSAWRAACDSVYPATIYVPPGKYLVGKTVFGGVCKSSAINIHIDGTLLAPADYRVIGSLDNWLVFEHVTGVSIYGGGTLDGQGTGLWACKASGQSCPLGATTLEFTNSDNISIRGITSVNSQMFHIVINRCNNVKVLGVTVQASGNSPNTDGIHIASSSEVTIMNSNIATGDDCISIGPGTTNLWIEQINCGPGHGISIGSLGWALEESGVHNVTVKTVTFTGTQNGVRIKTWAKPSNGFVNGVLFQHITMVNAANPIVIQQNYCPGGHNCPNQVSGVKISNVTYQDIHGSSATQVAMEFDCSKEQPCSGIILQDINLEGSSLPAKSSCVNAAGSNLGVVVPPSCL
ncbi:hypothetical protein RHMOL_Rhmol02G0211700 [Rhododendron molle]|uniref:Uncharacterized protein n=1 Tax=Rhododendron molle TaxID=49168 RepID=A0ACC0PUW5_RHOML|nr:hypothetical protein RHMOL_Rhmol02G0211700 [Rhododendron molle]